MSSEGTVFDIQRFSVHDGPGIRTLVFLKGCSLKCEWCANPESQAFAPELLFDPARCIGCENCLTLCTHGAVHKQGERILFEKEVCIGCGACAEKCYAEARVLKGRKMTVEAVVAEVLKDEAFYAASGGGVTLSGGEPLEQPGFSKCILEACKNLALHTAVETAGHVLWSSIESVIPFTDLFLFDIKHTDPAKLKKFTGGDAPRILQNIKKLAMRAKQIIVRTPVIPGFNDSPEEIQQIARLVKSLAIKGLHLLPYHRYGQNKYRLMGRKYVFRGPQQVETERMLALQDTASREGLEVQVGG
ncbi:MAG: glycyl-radical enzyme activating protein [Desulfobacterales bacterium]|nr:MAG: glycyl-radical enzyme activating protein [Desulfobacterales bacterium]